MTSGCGETEVAAPTAKERTLFCQRHIGFAYQAFNPISTLTAEENVTL